MIYTSILLALLNLSDLYYNSLTFKGETIDENLIAVYDCNLNMRFDISIDSNSILIEALLKENSAVQDLKLNDIASLNSAWIFYQRSQLPFMMLDLSDINGKRKLLIYRLNNELLCVEIGSYDLLHSIDNRKVYRSKEIQTFILDLVDDDSNELFVSFDMGEHIEYYIIKYSYTKKEFLKLSHYKSLNCEKLFDSILE